MTDQVSNTLQVMGAHLRQAGDCLERWDEALDNLAKAEDGMGHGSAGKLFGRLRVSYDALTPPEKRMFLDAATIFLGRRADTVKRAWRACVPLTIFLASMHTCRHVWPLLLCSIPYSK